jgi:hypothetical protein
MVDRSVTRQRVTALSAAAVLLVAAVLTMAFVARDGHDRPDPVGGLTDAQVSAARSHGLELRVNRIATEAGPAMMCASSTALISPRACFVASSPIQASVSSRT